MGNAVFAYGNLIDYATLSGGGWVGSLPLTNLQDRRLGAVARSNSASPAATQFDIAFSTTHLFRVIGLINHNFSQEAQCRIRFSNDPTFTTSVADSGWQDVWPTVYPFGTLPWGAENWWTGQYSADELGSTTKSLVYILQGSTNAQYVRVEISDPTNADGYVQIGRVFCADGWQPVRNVTYDTSSLAWEDPTGVQEALSGAEYFDPRTKRRIVRCGLDAMTEDEAMGVAFEIQRRMGISGEILFIWDPDDTTHALRRQFLARFRTLSPIQNPGPDRWSTAFEIKELL